MKRALFITALMAFAVNVQADKVASTLPLCQSCHAAGVNGAPKLGDAAAWEPRLAKGIDALVVSVQKGAGSMPGGMCNGCSEDDIKALIGKLSGQE